MNYLIADFSVVCGSAEWNQYLPLAVVCLIVYPIGIPLVLFVMLARNRHRLRQPNTVLALGIVYGLSCLLTESD